MRKQLKYTFLICTIALFIGSCSSDDGSVFDTPIPDNTDGADDGDNEEPEVATLVFNEADPSNNQISASANGEVGTTVPGRVIFTSDATTQRRMYITQNISGQGEMPFSAFDLVSEDLSKVLKPDGSIDLDGASKKEIDFTFSLPVPDIDNGEIVYTFWTTTGKGDFRDTTKRLALGAGTITVTVGTGTNPTAEVREFNEVKLFAPDVNGNTETFFSLLNETVYKVNVGREFRAFWDFGYYYGASGVSADDNASFSSTEQYDANFGFPVEGLQPGEDEENAETETLNQMFFASSDLDATAFDAITLSGELDFIASSDTQKITNLSVGDVVEFVDNYGKKGLIKVTAIQPGFGNNDFIEFSVKIQP
ncbi:hypothetical protein Q2T41_06570 [Maribacter confluentis]|uniref:Uncharacterized protein n=1 Tax=Maribacter confluentis TaxID=1656093 RepID=A0ABT8RN22_9FLAO|nr:MULTISPECIES: hypothetical protein [Maribacter]MDO1512317.1 hypothetical protein [Maribacter confluentis]TVZ15549.1 hypothetical protein JM81_1794 [Maribacter sp. MAR_2009_72]